MVKNGGVCAKGEIKLNRHLPYPFLLRYSAMESRLEFDRLAIRSNVAKAMLLSQAAEGVRDLVLLAYTFVVGDVVMWMLNPVVLVELAKHMSTIKSLMLGIHSFLSSAHTFFTKSARNRNPPVLLAPKPGGPLLNPPPNGGKPGAPDPPPCCGPGTDCPPVP